MPISPPSNFTLDPVILPSDFNNSPLELIDVESNVKPPITPEPVAFIVVAVMLPLIVALCATIAPACVTVNCPLPALIA